MSDSVSATLSASQSGGSLFEALVPRPLRRFLGVHPSVPAIIDERPLPTPAAEEAGVIVVVPEEALPVIQERPAPATPAVEDVSLVTPPVSPTTRRSNLKRHDQAAVAIELIQSRLFRLLGDARLESDVDFDTDAVMHKLFVSPQEVEQLCQLLAQPFIDGEKKIAAVIGLGGYGSTLAFGVARLLPPYLFGETELRSVSFLSVDRGGQGNQWRLSSAREAGSVLRAKKALIIAPVLTRTTCADIQVCVKLIEEALGVNATVFGVSALYQLQCSDRLPRGRNKAFDIRSVLRLDFLTHSHKSA